MKDSCKIKEEVLETITRVVTVTSDSPHFPVHNLNLSFLPCSPETTTIIPLILSLVLAAQELNRDGLGHSPTSHHQGINIHAFTRLDPLSSRKMTETNKIN